MRGDQQRQAIFGTMMQSAHCLELSVFAPRRSAVHNCTRTNFFLPNRNDSVLNWGLDNRGQAWRRPEMQNLDRYRAMESLCRQSAVFRPLESWRLLAEAEMWHHKALEEISSRSLRRDNAAPANVPIRTGSPRGRGGGRLLQS
jgi:hypothetical protein